MRAIVIGTLLIAGVPVPDCRHSGPGEAVHSNQTELSTANRQPRRD